MDYNEYLKKIMSKKEITLMNEEYSKKPITSLRINLLKYNTVMFENIFNNLDKHNYVQEAYYYDKEKYSFGKNPLHNAGAYYIQDASAMMVVHLLNIKNNDKVLDICAAPGGKSTQVASYLRGTGLLVSNDVSSKRVKDLSENIERVGAKNVIVMNENIEKISDCFEGYFDKVILDAPCSGQGMFRKNSLTYDDWSYEKTLNLTNIQKDLILKAYKCLKKDGIMVYSTCTFSLEENEEIIKYLLENSNASIVPIEKKEDFNSPIGIYGPIRLYPFNFKGEGHFICLIKCNDTHISNLKPNNKLAQKKDIELYRNFEKNTLNIELNGEFIKMGNELHLLPNDCFCLDKFRILRNGIHLGTIKEKRFEPNHAFAMCLKIEDVKNTINLRYNGQEIKNYLKGNTLETINKKGYVLICVEGISIGWGKDDGRLLKNLYPKGLRIQD